VPLPPWWASGDGEILAWRAHGLSDNEIVAAVQFEQGRKGEPPRGPKTIERAIIRYAKGVVGLPQADRARIAEGAASWQQPTQSRRG
jgi:hypothetical protein